ncbi:hypothetical protein SNE40_016566 [Patella caerulea]|uniref:Secreted protein n=1 Tax=Patella caerulea TaxID=87958 RepID=A0AAN8J8T8_PATCE
MKAVLILVIVAVISSRSYVDACDATSLTSCTLPTPGSANICNSHDAGCLAGAVENTHLNPLTQPPNVEREMLKSAYILTLFMYITLL